MKRFSLVCISSVMMLMMASCTSPVNRKNSPSSASSAAAQADTSQKSIPQNAREIYFAGGCFWGIEKLFEGLNGVFYAESGYANGNTSITPTYDRVLTGTTGYREAVHVVYDPSQITLNQLLTAFFHVIDPTVEKQQGNDIGDQYQTGIYYIDEADGQIIQSFALQERKKHNRFAVEIQPLSVFHTAEEYHQDYLVKNPNGYCHISQKEFDEVSSLIDHLMPVEPPAQKTYTKPAQQELRSKLSKLQYEVTQQGATERPYTGEYWDFDQKGIYVDIVTGEPLFSSLDKYHSSCGWPSFTAPIEQERITFHEDLSLGMTRTEVKSKAGDSHLGHVFYDDPESPNGVRYCINSASLKFIPYDELEAQGYGEWTAIFDQQSQSENKAAD